MRERLIFALDMPDVAEARRIVEHLGDSVIFHKVGLELFLGGGGSEFLDWLAGQGKRVFLDLKLFDVPETVKRAVARLTELPVDFTTVHGNDAILHAAGAAKGPRLKILAVTALTSLDEGDLRDLGFECDVESLVLSRAQRALEAGCDGVIASGREAGALRAALGPRLLVVTPGIRPVMNRSVDDQKRVATVEEAFRNGADYIVVGRPIRDAADPEAAAESIQESIVRAVAQRG